MISIIIVWRDCSLCLITRDVGTRVFKEETDQFQPDIQEHMQNVMRRRLQTPASHCSLTYTSINSHMDAISLFVSHLEEGGVIYHKQKVNFEV